MFEHSTTILSLQAVLARAAEHCNPTTFGGPQVTPVRPSRIGGGVLASVDITEILVIVVRLNVWPNTDIQIRQLGAMIVNLHLGLSII